MHSRAFLDRKTVDIPDAREAPPELAVGAKNFLPTGYRALTIMPLMRGRTAIGTLSVVRLAPGKLSARQIAALKTYAAQAVIAIENTRVLNELRESLLEQQTATAECSRLSARRPASLNRCSRPFWRMRPIYAEPNSARSICAKATHFTRGHFTTPLRLSSMRAKTRRFTPVPKARSPARHKPGRSLRSWMPRSAMRIARAIPSRSSVRTLAATGQSFQCRCSRMMS